MRLAGLRFSILFVALFILSLPISYHILPDIGGAISPVVEPIVGWVGSWLPGVEPPFTASILSDSTGMYINILVALLLAAVLAAVWSFVYRAERDSHRLRYWFHTAISYYLSLQLLRYGFEKVFKYQFYLPEPNTLLTPLGYLSPDILYWSMIGSSWHYSLFAGMLEIVPGLLLLFDRTRIVGAIGAAAVMTHVVMVNFAFDISVKIFSLFLLLLALIVAAPASGALLRLLTMGREVALVRWRPVYETGRKALLHAGVKSLLVGLILFESLYVYFATARFNDDMAARPFLHGAWNVELFVGNGDTVAPLTSDTTRFRRIFVHRRGYFITQGMDDSMTDYRLGYDTINRRLRLERDAHLPIELEYSLQDGDSVLLLRGVIAGDSVSIMTRRIDLEKMPLLQGGFHWTIDGYR